MKNVALSFSFALLLFAGSDCWRLSTEEVDNSHPLVQDDSGRVEFHNGNIYVKDPRAMSIEEFEEEKNTARTISEASRNVKTDVDEELIRKAEKTADEDLLDGLNAILKNNETLEDVLDDQNFDYQP